MADDKNIKDELTEVEDLYDEEYDEEEYDDEYEDDDEYEYYDDDEDEDEYSIYEDWTPTVRAIAWGSIIVTIAAAIILMETMFKNL